MAEREPKLTPVEERAFKKRRKGALKLNTKPKSLEPKPAPQGK